MCVSAPPDPSDWVPCGADLHPLHRLRGPGLALPLHTARVCAREGRHGDDHPPHSHRHVQLCRRHLTDQLLLQTTTQVRQNVPRVSYVSYLDIWMLTCMIFVFSCILEFIVVTALNRTGEKRHGGRVSDRSSPYLRDCVYFPSLYDGPLTANNRDIRLTSFLFLSLNTQECP